MTQPKVFAAFAGVALAAGLGGAALYDARGYYNDTTLITGAANQPLSSYAIALPFYESFLTPYIVEVPEPATWSLLGIAAALGLLVKVRSRRVAYKP